MIVFNLKHSERPAELPLPCCAAVVFIKLPGKAGGALTQEPPVQNNLIRTSPEKSKVSSWDSK